MSSEQQKSDARELALHNYVRAFSAGADWLRWKTWRVTSFPSERDEAAAAAIERFQTAAAQIPEIRPVKPAGSGPDAPAAAPTPRTDAAENSLANGYQAMMVLCRSLERELAKWREPCEDVEVALLDIQDTSRDPDQRNNALAALARKLAAQLLETKQRLAIVERCGKETA